MKTKTGGLSVAFAASILGSFGCGPAVADEEPVSQVREAANIANFNDLLAMGSTGSFTLTADIDMNGRSWTPKNFSGTFDGGNHTIRRLAVTNGSLFGHLSGATIRNLKLTSVNVTGSSLGGLGGLAASAEDSTVESCAIEATVNVSAYAAGGIFGSMSGGSIFRSYAKGTVTGSILHAGGFVGIMNPSNNGLGTISESYAQTTVDTGDQTDSIRFAGGLVGYSNQPNIYDVYVVGNVKGRGGVGGMVGAIHCLPYYNFFYLYKTIYRGEVVDRNKSAASGGWAGAVGTYDDCSGSRFIQNFYDRTLDPSTNRAHNSYIQGWRTDQLKSPRTVIEGVFCAPDIVEGRCGDNTWSEPPWTAGSDMQHHVLLNMPGPNAQLR